jgi:hypothetical protein
LQGHAVVVAIIITTATDTCFRTTSRHYIESSFFTNKHPGLPDTDKLISCCFFLLTLFPSVGGDGAQACLVNKNPPGLQNGAFRKTYVTLVDSTNTIQSDTKAIQILFFAFQGGRVYITNIDFEMAFKKFWLNENRPQQQQISMRRQQPAD